jgi:S-formylglutathione hydrolase FrmB
MVKNFYVNQTERNAYYSTYVAQELVEVTRKIFPLSKNREDTFIGGISMGGYGSLMLGVKYKDNVLRCFYATVNKMS